MDQIDNIISALYAIRLNETGRNEWLTMDDGTDTSGIYTYAGNPEGNVAANIGSICLDTSAGQLYRKTTDTVNTGWVTAGISTPVSVANGGTGQTSLTDNRLLVGDGTSPVQSLLVSWGNSIIGTFNAGPITMPQTWRQGINGMSLNLSMSLASNTVTIKDYTGTDLGINNPGIITIPSNGTDGEMIARVLSANLVYNFDNLTGALFNMPTGENHAESFPVYLGVLLNATDNSTFPVVSVAPHIVRAPSNSAEIGMPSGPSAASQQWSICFIDQNVTAADYVDHHIMYIGSVTCTRNGSDVWTVDALNMDYDGIGKFQEGRQFTHGVGLFGAGSGSPIAANGGTAPVFTTNYVDYSIGIDGQIDYNCEYAGDGGTDGSGAVSAILQLPFSPKTADSADRITIGHGWGTTSALGNLQANIVNFPGTDANGVFFVYNGTNNTLNSSYGNGARRWNMHCRYMIDDGRQ